MKHRWAFAIPVVMMVLSVFVVIITAVFTAGVNTLHLTSIAHESKQSLYAAEAGLAQSFRQIIAGTSGWNGYAATPYGRDSSFTVQVFPAGSAPPGLGPVPPGCAYLLATGRTLNKFPRQVGVMIKAGNAAASASDFNFAIAAGRRIEMQGGGQIVGSLKASEDIRMQGGIRVAPSNGSGRILAGEDLTLQGGIRWDDSQDLRARQEIRVRNQSLPPDPANLIFSSDTSPDSLPFINDGRFTNALNTGERGVVMPNPDPERLLGLRSDGAGGYQIDSATGLYLVDPSRTDVVQHSETSYSGNSNFDLGGKIHFFPKGVSFGGNTNFTGQGTIVTGDGQSMTFQGNTGTMRANLLALSWPRDPNKGDIRFQGNHDVQGLVLAHRRIETQGNFNLHGVLIAYSEDVDGQGNRRVSYDASGFQLPGLESWRGSAGGPAGPGSGTGIAPGLPLQILSWQRL